MKNKAIETVSRFCCVMPPWILFIMLGLLSLACGSGGGGSLASTSISGTGSGSGTTSLSKVSGSIDSFGSLYVGGIHFNTDALNASLEGASGNITDLEVGMWVSVEGTVDLNSLSGNATNLVYETHQAGLVSALGAGNQFVINGVTVESDDLTRTSPNLSLPLSLNQRVRLSGQYLSSGNFYATHIGEHVATWTKNKSAAELRSERQQALADTSVLHVSQLEVSETLSSNVFKAEGLTLDFKDAKEAVGDQVRPPKLGERVVVRAQTLVSGNLQVLSYVSRANKDPAKSIVTGVISALAGSGSKPAVTMSGQIYKIEPFTVFKDLSFKKKRRFGYRELLVGDSVQLELSQGGVVLSLKRR
jgi:hypothetical protein